MYRGKKKDEMEITILSWDNHEKSCHHDHITLNMKGCRNGLLFEWLVKTPVSC